MLLNYIVARICIRAYMRRASESITTRLLGLPVGTQGYVNNRAAKGVIDARILLTAALGSVPFGFVLVRVRDDKNWNWYFFSNYYYGDWYCLGEMRSDQRAGSDF